MSEGPGEPSFADVLNGISGGTGRRRGDGEGRRGARRGLFRRRDEATGAGADEATDAGADETGAVDRFSVGGSQSARIGPATPSGGDSGVPPGSQEETPPWGLDRFEHPGGVDDDPSDDADEASFVRPYAWTGGRTRPVYRLAVETLISLGPHGRDPSLVRKYEHRAVADLCRESVSVAEIAALLKLPLGVARVLLADMAAQGTVVVHQTASTSEEGPDMALMERVLSGLRRL